MISMTRIAATMILVCSYAIPQTLDRCGEQQSRTVNPCSSGKDEVWHYEITDPGTNGGRPFASWGYKSAQTAQKAAKNDELTCETVEQYFHKRPCKVRYGTPYCGACKAPAGGLGGFPPNSSVSPVDKLTTEKGTEVASRYWDNPFASRSATSIANSTQAYESLQKSQKRLLQAQADSAQQFVNQYSAKDDLRDVERQLNILELEAGNPSVFEFDNRRSVDLSKYSIIFYVRQSPGSTGFPGHIFVIMGKEDIATGTSSDEAWGFYPAEGSSLTETVIGTSGEIRDEYRGGRASLPPETMKLNVLVDKEHYEKALDVVRRWRTGGSTYSLLNNDDCVKFVNEIARAAGLRTSFSRFEKPNSYLRDLVQQNN